MKVLVYGATGYAGRLVSRALAARGVAHIVAGRRRDAVLAFAGEVGQEPRTFPLEAPILDGVSGLLNCAGPFSRTAMPLARAAIGAGVHYLDLAGELAEHEAVRALDADALRAGSMLMPGVGFGIVPTECASAMAVAKLPTATTLTIAYETVGGASRGTLETVLGGLGEPGFQRVGGVLVPASPAEEEKELDLGDGLTRVATNPWRADLIGAHHATKVPSIRTFATFPAPLRWLMRSRVKRAAAVRGVLSWLTARAPEGPSPAERKAGRTRVLAIADDGARYAEVRVLGPEAYDFTARAAAAVAARLAEAKPGYRTPSQVFEPGALLASIEGVEVHA